MKKKVLLGLLVCVVGLFSACSSDNNNDNKGGNTVVTGEKIIGLQTTKAMFSAILNTISKEDW